VTVDVDDLGRSATAEWATLVTTAVLGTDRRPLAPAAAGWASPLPAPDPAVELLNRAACVATARRAGARPLTAPARIPPAPPDPRPLCPAPAAAQLERMLNGQHDILLPEWFALCRDAGYQLPLHLLPALLLRGRRFPHLDAVVRSVAGERAAWLAEAMPELKIRSMPLPVPANAEPFAVVPAATDSAAVVSAIVGTFLERTASWAVAGQMRVAVASLEPKWLPALILELNRAPFHVTTERTRVELLGLAQLRSEMWATFPTGVPEATLTPSV
jgi:hypothetical protein